MNLYLHFHASSELNLKLLKTKVAYLHLCLHLYIYIRINVSVTYFEKHFSTNKKNIQLERSLNVTKMHYVVSFFIFFRLFLKVYRYFKISFIKNINIGLSLYWKYLQWNTTTIPEVFSLYTKHLQMNDTIGKQWRYIFCNETEIL